MTHTALSLIDRLMTAGFAGEVPDAGDMAVFALKLHDATAGKSIDEALGLAPGWFRVQRAAEIGRLLVEIADPTDSAREAARKTERALSRYASSARFAGDQGVGYARNPKDAGLYRLMTMFKNGIPDAEALRKAKERYASGA